jgi:hypothetical protein
VRGSQEIAMMGKRFMKHKIKLFDAGINVGMYILRDYMLGDTIRIFYMELPYFALVSNTEL